MTLIALRHGVHICLLLAFVAGTTWSASAQCRPSEAEAFLDVNGVRSRVVNDGALFPWVWRQGAGYVVPKDTGVSPLFGGAIHLAGMVDGELRATASRSRSDFREFWPGPLPGPSPDSLDCAPYDRIFELTAEDLAALNSQQILTDNVLNWPWMLGAPVVDGDGNPENYDPLAGDRPALLGDQMLWWLMHDGGGPHQSTGTEPVGLEVRGSAFAHRVSGDIDLATFYDLTLTARNDVQDAYFGLWVDGDLGDSSDDYLGVDSLLHLGYFYNADEQDGDPGSLSYGTPPPAVGIVFLKGPSAEANLLDDDRDGQSDEIGEEMGLASFVCGVKTVEARTAIEYHNVLQGLLPDGRSLRNGGSYGQPDASLERTSFCLPGDPVVGDFWSAENLDGSGTRLEPRDVRSNMNLGPFTLRAGEPVRIAFAVVWARGADRLDSVSKLRDVAAHFRNVADVLLDPLAHYSGTSSTPPPPEPALGLKQTYPNPSSGLTVFELSVPYEAFARLEVVDLLGRSVETLMSGSTAPGTYRIPFDVSNLTPGLYFYRYHLDQQTVTRKMTVVR